MEQVKELNISKDDIVKSPKDLKCEAIIVNMYLGQLKDFRKPESIKYNADKEVLKIEFEYKFEDNIYKDHDIINWYDKPKSNSQLAKFMMKYDSKPTIQQKIVIDVNGEGFAGIVLE